MKSKTEKVYNVGLDSSEISIVINALDYYSNKLWDLQNLENRTGTKKEIQFFDKLQHVINVFVRATDQ